MRRLYLTYWHLNGVLDKNPLNLYGKTYCVRKQFINFAVEVT